MILYLNNSYKITFYVIKFITVVSKKILQYLLLKLFFNIKILEINDTLF